MREGGAHRRLVGAVHAECQNLAEARSRFVGGRTEGILVAVQQCEARSCARQPQRAGPSDAGAISMTGSIVDLNGGWPC